MSVFAGGYHNNNKRMSTCLIYIERRPGCQLLNTLDDSVRHHLKAGGHLPYGRGGRLGLIGAAAQEGWPMRANLMDPASTDFED